MVGGQDDHCVVQLPRLLQLVQQALHGQLQFYLAGQITPDLLAVGQVLDCVPVAGRHGVALQGVGQVAAHREAVDGESVLADKHGDDLLHHFQVGGRKALP